MIKPLINFDTETTGSDPCEDEIVEIYARKHLPDGEVEELHFFINPIKPCHPEAEKIHGYTAEFLADKPRMTEVVKEIWEFFDGCDVGGYNADSFDVILLACEFQRHGYYWKIEELNIVDGFAIWRAREPRTLKGFVDRFSPVKDTKEEFHGAKFDVLQYELALEGATKQWGIDGKSATEMHKIGRERKATLDAAGKLFYLPNGDLATTMDKYDYHKTGLTLREIFEKDLQYIRYCIGPDSKLNGSTKFWLKRLYTDYMEGN